MKATKIYPVAALLALSLAACNNEEITTTPDARVALQVTGGIQTRAYDATWEANDEIGIFGFTQEDAPAQAYSNVRYVTTGGNGAFTPDGTTIYLPTDGSSLDFVAYYPHTTDLEWLTIRTPQTWKTEFTRWMWRTRATKVLLTSWRQARRPPTASTIR